MGIALPQLAPASEDRVSGAQVIDGSLKFDPDANNHLTKTPSGAGNRRTFTLSYWIKESGKGTSPYNNPHILWSGTGTATRGGFAHRGTGSDAGKLYLFNQESNSTNCQVWTNSLHRDFSAWKHIVLAVDTTQATSTDRVKIYINGTQETLTFSTTPAENLQLQINIAQVHQIGRGATDDYGNYYLSQPYFIDGLALGPESFGYTDPLTNTWRPKKYTGDFNGPSSGSGTVYSSTSTANNAATMFDGSTSTYASSALNSGSYQTVTEASITFTSGSFTYNTNNCGSTGGSSNRYLRLTRQSDGATTEITVNDCNGWTIPTEYRNTIISKIEWKRWSSFENVSAVYVDGTMLVNAIVNPAGVNGFYLPMDGNSPIGEDKSGQGNNWTPVNFGGSVALPKATGARPILNTDGGGNVARPGVFGSEQNVGYAVTVYDDGGGNKYYIDGTKQATLNGLIRGATYTFDTSDSTLGSTHPFRLSATSAHGTEYTDGVVAITGAATTITVPHNAPNSLYYYCTAHSGMGSNITGITTNEKLADPYAWKNVLAFANGTSDISNSINCTSTTKTVTNDGVAVVSTNSEFYGSSLQFESANTDSLTVENADFAMGTGDLTVEFWVYNKTNKNFNAFISTRETSNGTTAGWVIATDTAGDLYVHSGAALAGNYSGDITLPLNQWSHVAYTRASGTHRLFLNGGAAANSTTTSRDFTEDK